jgi:ABC-type multidrug transport system ATPase subunit
MAPLAERFRDALEEAGQNVDPGSQNLAVDLVRLLVRTTGGELGVAGRQVVDSALSAQLDLNEQARKILLDLALAPRFRTTIEPAELRAFEAFFGRKAAGKLRGEQTEELGLEGFSVRYGSESSLILLDALFRVASADGRMEEVQARRLERAAAELGVDELVVTALFQRYDPANAAGDHSWLISGTRMTVGRAPGNDVVIPDPQVAKHHCSFLFVGGRWRVEARSGRPVLVDGELISSAPVLESTRIGIGPWTLQMSEGRIVAYGHRSFQPLCVQNLRRKIDGVTLLDGISFTVFTGEVIALVGPSGAGKTTLINAISGIAPADSGEVLLGGRNFHTQLAADPSGVGFVPQEDLVHPELTVEESLFYSGCLRFSSDVSRTDIEKEVERVLQELDIRGIRSNRIGDSLKRGISGGQRKRVNLGQEMLTRSTRVLFLDEPTSGLDPRSSHGIAKKVRVAADGGRIVFLVTHDLSAGLLQQVDHLLVIVEGGRLGYFGKPEDACRYFKVATPDLIFERLADREPMEWAAHYRDSKDYRRFVQSREHLLGLNAAKDQESVDGADDEKTSILPLKRPTSLHQLRTLTSRYFRTKMRDHVGMSVFLAQPPLLALMMWIVFPAPTVPALFMVSLSWIWFGLSASVRELIIDRAIWKRERRVGVGVNAYIGSKVLVLGGMVAAQCVLFTVLTWFALDMRAAPYSFDLPMLMSISVLTGLAGFSLSLMISAVFSSGVAAVSSLPLLIIPQICFSAILVPLQGMGALAKGITWITIERFAFEATLKSGARVDEWVVHEFNTKPTRGALFDLGFKTSDINNMGLPFALSMLALALFSVVFLSVAWWVVWRRDRLS